MLEAVNLITLIASLLLIGSIHADERLVIETPEQYSQLINGEFSPDYDVIVIKSSAHPVVLSLPKTLANAPWPALQFFDGHERIFLFPRWKESWFKCADNASTTLHLPLNYTSYEVFYGADIAVSSKEIDYILSWTTAERLLIADRSDVAYDLYKRIGDFQRFKHLRQLGLTIQRQSYKKIDVAVFLNSLPALARAHFRATALTKEEFDEFVRQQQPQADWKSEINGQFVSFYKTE